MSLIIISEVGEGDFMKGMGGSNYCLSVRGEGGAMSRSPQM